LNVFKKLIFKVYLATLKQEHSRFIASLKKPDQAQLKYLFDMLHANQNTNFGKKYQFQSLKTIESYQALVPVHSYADIQDDMDQVFQGSPTNLVGSLICLFEKTSGTSSRNKIIPFTQKYLQEVNRATSAWIYQCFLTQPKMIGKKLYYSISPQMREKEFSPTGIPVGMSDDTDYLGFFGKFFVRLFMAVPASVSQIKNAEDWKRQTLLHLVEREDLGFISLWSPTLLQVWIRFLESADQTFLNALSESARKRLEKSQRAGLALSVLWPNLSMVSFWIDGPSSSFFEDLKHHLVGIYVQAKGLMATEGIVSIPMDCADGAPLAINCHFLEFFDLETQEVCLPWTLKVGKKYSPIISNSAGLYRYHLKDVIECTGYFHNTPLVRFVSKLESVSDLCGEKLSTEQVIEAIAESHAELGLKWKWMQVLASKQNGLKYFILTDAEVGEFARIEAHMDEKLRKNIHYDYARKLGQLESLKCIHFPLSYLQDQYQNFMISEKVKLGDIKFQPLMSHDRLLTFLLQNNPN
jgi:hypothetical protein